MKRGIVYIMTTAVSGLIKIGRTQADNYAERMRFLEANGYYNVVGLKRSFAMELDDYTEKEALLHEIFSKHRVANSELFALDQELVRQLLLSFDGVVVYPEKVDKEKVFDQVAKVRRQGARFSFYQKGMKQGDVVRFASDASIEAVVVGEREVEYAGQKWKLSPLTYKIFEEKGTLNASGAYQGANYWMYEGVKLWDMPDV